MIKERTFGEKAVDLSINPPQPAIVFDLKSFYADIIDTLNRFRTHTSSPEARELATIAIREAQTAQMWAVKAVTWKD